MNPECEYLWSILHVLWSVVYVACGAAQLVAGIFFFISVPMLNLSNNLWIGIWNVVIGISVGMVACFGRISPVRQEILLYMSVSILISNTINALYNEWSFYNVDVGQMIKNNSYQTLIKYACYATRISAGAIILLSFLDSQLSFCSMQSAPKSQNKSKLRDNHEQVSDIEYIIPRAKSSKSSALNPYSQSWVYDASAPTQDPSYSKVSQNGTPQIFKKLDTLDPDSVSFQDKAHLVDNPVVHIEEASDDSTSNSDRKLCHMKSFSPSASPLVLSASSSQLSLNQQFQSPPHKAKTFSTPHRADPQAPIYECLEKLTNPAIYRQRLNSNLSSKSDGEPHYHTPQSVLMRRSTPSPRMEKVQYASLMKELQRAIGSKKEKEASPPSKTSSNSNDSRHESSRSAKSSDDAEFSKELEAALQLIQDLESPNTGDTPSEEPKVAAWRRGSGDSEKTLSPSESLTETTTFEYSIPAQASAPGKLEAAKCIGNSQSTSGYSSPDHRQTSWSTGSSLSDSPVTFSVITNTHSAALISLYSSHSSHEDASSSLLSSSSSSSSSSDPSRAKSVTLVTIAAGDGDVSHVKDAGFKAGKEGRKVESSLAYVKSLLRRKDRNVPKLRPELEDAIVKSESLAYLSENELLARHQRNATVQREIEQRVLQQLGVIVPRTESNC